MSDKGFFLAAKGIPQIRGVEGRLDSLNSYLIFMASKDCAKAFLSSCAKKNAHAHHEEKKVATNVCKPCTTMHVYVFHREREEKNNEVHV